jgi:hypothetical protein
VLTVNVSPLIICMYVQRIYTAFLSILQKKFNALVEFLVENIGLEPMTPCVQGRCSKPTELIPRVYFQTLDFRF